MGSLEVEEHGQASVEGLDKLHTPPRCRGNGEGRPRVVLQGLLVNSTHRILHDGHRGGKGGRDAASHDTWRCWAMI